MFKIRNIKELSDADKKEHKMSAAQIRVQKGIKKR